MSVDADADADADAASGADEPEAPASAASAASAAQVARTLSEPHTGTLLLALALSHAQRSVIVALTHMFITPEVRTGNSPSEAPLRRRACCQEANCDVQAARICALATHTSQRLPRAGPD